VTGYAPDIGDVIWISLDPTQGHEQQGRRTLLVLTPERYNRRTSLVVGCPTTNQIKGYPFEVPLSGTADVTGVVLCDQLKSLDWRAGAAALQGRVDAGTIQNVKSLIKKLLAIS
jgi:mRNA interferase MazF